MLKAVLVFPVPILQSISLNQSGITYSIIYLQIAVPGIKTLPFQISAKRLEIDDSNNTLAGSQMRSTTIFSSNFHKSPNQHQRSEDSMWWGRRALSSLTVDRHQITASLGEKEEIN